MTKISDQLLGAERLDVREFARRVGQDFPELKNLGRCRVGDATLLELAQEMLDRLQVQPPPPVPAAGGPASPWWTSMPSTYVAALLLHCGMTRLGGGSGAEGLPPHALESARLAREVLRGLEVPFAVREHAVALIRHFRRPDGLVGSGSPEETFRRLACRLDLRSLYYLKKAQLEVPGTEQGGGVRQTLGTFRGRAEEAGCWEGPPAPPLGQGELSPDGEQEGPELHRRANALRYFELCADADGPEWCRRRLAQETGMPRGRLNLLVGPAGSGKSRWARGHLRGDEIVSSDQMRKELTGDPTDQSQNYLVFQRCLGRIRSLLKEGRGVTFDATNYSEELRRGPLKAARWCAAEVRTYFMDVPLRGALMRNHRRGRRVPEPIIRRHYRLLSLPALYEADRHIRVDEAGRAALYWPAPAERGKVR